ncbi:MAG TPA: kynureninase [Micromonosporaceae bacterium]|nr:kynureninase [Micromonosporaceae bacterium]
MVDVAAKGYTLQAAQEHDADDPLREFRDRFVVADPDLVYLDGNSLGRLPVDTRDALRDAVESEWGSELIRGWSHWSHLSRKAGDEIARGVVQAKPGEVIVTDSTSVNLYKLAAAALAAQPDRRVIVTDDDNFPADAYVLQGLENTGHELRIIHTDMEAGVDVEAVREAIGPDTALVSLMHVAYRSGALADMAAITRIVHDAGALMLWDLCHSAGAVPVPLSDADVDLAVSCTYKYLNSGPGAPAFLYVRRDLQQRLHPPIWGWYGQRDQFDMDMRYQPMESIERFLVGTPWILGCRAVLHGARLINEAGINRIYAKGQALTSYAVELADAWLSEFGVRLASPRDPRRRGCHITLHHPQAWQLRQALIDRNVIPDYRNPERLRLGFAPIYTRFVDVHRGMARLREILAEQTHLMYPAERTQRRIPY